MRNPLVTIAIPAYKATYLAEAIQSALNQSYSNIELIIVNDKSPESIKSIVNSFKDSRIKYYENEQNIGGKDPVANWNKCLSLATGEYFALLCDDDLYAPTFVERMLELASKFPICNVFRARGCEIDGQGNVTDFYPTSPEWEESLDYLIDLEGMFRKQTISEFLYRRNHIIKLGGYSPLPMAWYADNKSVAVFAMEGGIASSSEILVSFRRSGLNITSKRDKNTREKVRADNLYTNWIEDIAKQLESEKSRILVQHRLQKKWLMFNSYLMTAHWKEFLYLWKKRKNQDFQIAPKMFIKAILNKLRNRLSLSLR